MKGFFQKIFSQDKESRQENKTLPVDQDEIESVKVIHHSSLQPPQFLASCGQSVGMQRDHNEDALFILTTTLTSDHSSLPFGLYIVADGMGGHQHGEIASGIAIRSMSSYIVSRLLTPLLHVNPVFPEESLVEIMQAGVQESHKAITNQVPGGGTTMTAVLILDEQMILAHVGDSRAYSIDLDGNMNVLTRDHSLVKRLEELGQISHEEAANHPQRNVLYRALGQGEPFDPDIKNMQLPSSGYLLLCSDGLWGVVEEEEIRQVIHDAPTITQACKSLVDAANAAGGPDNITAILIRLPG
ncbi:MAG: PP2C family protein-serine/threonine phosphatase [Anaerolineales bacterium]